mmetsp:Transcript_34102/g.78799  ORF Transcript_34102/g.78799 Transcript_34102/m.78799 type:complete len:211 (-) Transcript_34102:2248-2880(-)
MTLALAFVLTLPVRVLALRDAGGWVGVRVLGHIHAKQEPLSRKLELVLRPVVLVRHPVSLPQCRRGLVLSEAHPRQRLDVTLVGLERWRHDAKRTLRRACALYLRALERNQPDREPVAPRLEVGRHLPDVGPLLHRERLGDIGLEVARSGGHPPDLYPQVLHLTFERLGHHVDNPRVDEPLDLERLACDDLLVGRRLYDDDGAHAVARER